MEAWQNKIQAERSAIEHSRRAREDLASEKAQTAHSLEKTRPEEAIALYRESLAIRKEIIENFPEDQWRWRDFPYLYNRLTLILERLGFYEQALEDIKEYYALGHRNLATKSEREAIEKRRKRLRKKM